MHSWSPVFYLRFLAYLILGFGAYYALQPTTQVMYMVYPILWLLYLVLLQVYQRFTYPYAPLLLGILGGMILMLSGGLRVGQIENRLEQAQSARLDSVQALQVILEEDFRLKGNYWRGIAQVESYRRGGRWQDARAKLLLYVPAQDSLLTQEKLLYQSRFILRGKAQLVNPPSNPGTFNFQAFYRNQGMVYQYFAKPRRYHALPSAEAPSLFGFMYALRRNLAHIIDSRLPGEEDQAIVSALLLGIKNGLNPEIKAVFADSGLMHILAVSGLHVGFLVWLLHIIFRGLLGLPYGKGIYTGILILLLWGYVILTGSSPSVLRAVCLFSFILVGRVWNKRPNYYNLLAASAFYLLLYDPFLVFSVGFQLSYAAVAAILYIQPRLYRLWEPQSWILQYIWALLTVSVAAQLGTFPLSVYYFHQFPNYFLVANVLILPLVPLILYGAWAMVLFSWILPLSQFIALLLAYVLRGVLFLTSLIQDLPGATWDGIYWYGSQVVLMYSILFLFLSQLNRPRKWVPACVLLLGVFWAILSLNQAYKQHTQRGLGVFSLYAKGLVYFYQGSEAILLCDSSHRPREKDWQYTINPSLHYQGIHNIRAYHMEDTVSNLPKRILGNQALIVWGKKKILWAYKPLEETDLHRLESIQPDYWLLSKNALEKISDSLDLSTMGYIILDSSIPPWQAEKFLAKSTPWKEKIFLVSKQGAWKVSF